MSEAAIILAVANLFFSGIVIYMNMRQGKILSELRKQEKLFDVNLTRNLDRLNKVRELLIEYYAKLDQIMSIAISATKRKGNKTNASMEEVELQIDTEVQKLDRIGLELDSFIASLKDNTLTTRYKAHEIIVEKVADQISDILDSETTATNHDEIAFNILSEIWDCTLILTERIHELETDEKNKLLNPTRTSLLKRLRKAQSRDAKLTET